MERKPTLPFVTVIMNIWNGAAYLREAIDCVIAQDHQDWELIAWDDCSTDESAAIVKSYTDPRVRYFLSPEQTPLGRARHLALQVAKGDWVAFLDQDDLWVPEKLSRQLQLATSASDVGFVYGRTVSFTPDGSRRDFDHRHEFAPLPEGPILEQLFTDSCFVAMSSALFRRSALEELGGIPSNIHMSPDYFMYLGVSQRYKARAVQDVVCYYRLHGNNMTPRTFKQVHSEVLWLIDRWGGSIRPSLREHRRKVHETLVAFEDFRRGQRKEGIQRLLKRGSLTYLLSRPFAQTFRALRRKFQRPIWQRSKNASGSGVPA